MPDLKLPLMPDLVNGDQILDNIWAHLFINEGASERDIQLVRDSVVMARRILLKINMNLWVVPPNGMDGRGHWNANGADDIGTFPFNGPLFIDGVDQHGRATTTAVGASQARAEAAKKIGYKNEKIKPVVVLFGPATSTRARGHTTESFQFPWFCEVSTLVGAKTTMLHEIGHCANMQHYMANTLLSDETTKDPKNIMAEVPDHQADQRDRFNPQEIGLLKAAYFFWRI